MISDTFTHRQHQQQCCKFFSLISIHCESCIRFVEFVFFFKNVHYRRFECISASESNAEKNSYNNNSKIKEKLNNDEHRLSKRTHQIFKTTDNQRQFDHANADKQV